MSETYASGARPIVRVPAATLHMIPAEPLRQLADECERRFREIAGASPDPADPYAEAAASAYEWCAMQIRKAAGGAL